MTQALDSLITAIHRAPRSGVFTVTGGGSGLLSGLLGVGGASATVLEANVPYAPRSLRDWLGSEPAQACSDETARSMAVRAFMRAVELGGDFGFAITASLATTRPKRGALRGHLAFQDAMSTRTWRLDFEGSAGDRREQERTLAAVAVEALGHALDVGDAPNVPGTHAQGDTAHAELMLGKRGRIGDVVFDAVLPGAFNPIHDGHRHMRVDAERRLGSRVGFELSITNVDKPPLDYHELNTRLEQFDDGEVVLTNAPTFIDKARTLGGVVFVVGADTMRRVAEPQYYGGVEVRDAAVEELAALGCRFLVYGRLDAGVFTTLSDLTLPPALAAISSGVPESEFRNDLSSTALRSGP
ncbi:MAG: hypothetical protein OXQ90_10770 [Gammaproteobacteria bacterium]|nr:hypothetical protein [Gammaproteobacteria bacterium]